MIVVNTLSGAVSEYTRHPFQSLTPAHAGSSTGLFAFGGDFDSPKKGDEIPIEACIHLPVVLQKNSFKTRIDMVYLSMMGLGQAVFTVLGPNGQAWPYSFPLVAGGLTRCKPGAGIRENYLGFELCTPGGQAFCLDRLEILTLPSKNRRV